MPVRRHVGRHHAHLVILAFHQRTELVKQLFVLVEGARDDAEIDLGIIGRHLILVPDEQSQGVVAIRRYAAQRLEYVDVVHRVVHRLAQAALQLLPDHV